MRSSAQAYANLPHPAPLSLLNNGATGAFLSPSTDHPKAASNTRTLSG